MNAYVSQSDLLGTQPVVANHLNITKPTSDDEPVLLTWDEVTTTFHEFGHALHGILANTVYPHLSGTNVHWDFVELPSQILENWCYEQESLELFAKHYQTGETIPMEYVQKIRESATFHEGMQTLRQLSFGMLDMAWHGSDPSGIANVKEFESNAFASTQLYPETHQTCMSTSFSHIFQGGYSAGYYSYIWSEVLDADSVKWFHENGGLKRENGDHFRKTLLSRGGSEDAMTIFKTFRGAEPNVEHLLKRRGLTAK